MKTQEGKGAKKVLRAGLAGSAEFSAPCRIDGEGKVPLRTHNYERNQEHCRGGSSAERGLGGTREE